MSILLCGLAAALVAASTADGPRTDHALGVYDARLQRLLLIGGAGDPGPGNDDRVWSWIGTRWELMTDAGPPGRVNAGAAYDVRGARTIVAGGQGSDRASPAGRWWGTAGNRTGMRR
jgi:hypothetical protein